MSLWHTNFPASNGFAPLFRLLDDYDVHRSNSSRSGQSTAMRSFSARFDVRESDNAYHLDGELPGIVQSGIDIEFTDPQTLVVKGRTEREYQSSSPSDDSTETEEGDGKSGKLAYRFWAEERSVGEFQRTFTFPTRVDQDAVKANLKNGILSIVVPKAAAPTAKKITVE
ncbi:30 kDa heat shock protein [Penicillium lagena]|uniref:30 kDa heat shock protein n=1 Tax=Penicillium lagena TaxID=94218 RepID=UPI0025424641|nr:30 kDa heat shock protein [Penicillium lagena]KAJ5626253.1 30 kDa heat shock protein [Penicillium lagena]